MLRAGVSWSADGAARLALVGHTDTVNRVAFTADSAQLVSVSQDRTTRIWSVAEAKLLRSFSDTDAMAQVAAHLREQRAHLNGLTARLAGASYESVLARGFALVRDIAGHPVTTAVAMRFPGRGRCSARCRARNPQPVSRITSEYIRASVE